MSDRQEELEASQGVSHSVNKSIAGVLDDSLHRLKARRQHLLEGYEEENQMRSNARSVAQAERLNSTPQPALQIFRHLLPESHQKTPSVDPSFNPMSQLREARQNRNARIEQASPQAPTVSRPSSGPSF